jgi:hypothetical protein
MRPFQTFDSFRMGALFLQKWIDDAERRKPGLISLHFTFMKHDTNSSSEQIELLKTTRDGKCSKRS